MNHKSISKLYSLEIMKLLIYSHGKINEIITDKKSFSDEELNDTDTSKVYVFGKEDNFDQTLTIHMFDNIGVIESGFLPGKALFIKNKDMEYLTSILSSSTGFILYQGYVPLPFISKYAYAKVTLNYFNFEEPELSLEASDIVTNSQFGSKNSRELSDDDSDDDQREVNDKLNELKQLIMGDDSCPTDNHTPKVTRLMEDLLNMMDFTDKDLHIIDNAPLFEDNTYQQVWSFV